MQVNLVSKSDFTNFVKKVDWNKNELNELKKVKAISTKQLTKDLINKFSILNGAKYFSSGIFEIFFVCVIAKKFIKYFSSTTRKSNGMSEEYFENITEWASNFAPTFFDHHFLSDLLPSLVTSFNGHILINNIYIPNIYIYIYIYIYVIVTN